MSEKFRIVFLTLTGYTSISLSNAMDALRIANIVSGKDKYQWDIATLDGQPAQASSGLSLTPTVCLADINHIDMAFVCGGADVESAITPELLFELKMLADQGIKLGSLCTGGLALAAAGLLDKHAAVFHWEQKASIAEKFPRIILSDQLFCVDRKRYTCTSGPASLYLMLHIIGEHLGRSVATQVSDQLALDRIRDSHDKQYVPLSTQVGLYHNVLIEVAALMESNLEEPLPMGELASLVGVSKRQIERLFSRYVGEVPTKYYLELRMLRARRLLLETSMTVMQVSVACGFQSAPHFSKCYRDRFGVAPRVERTHRQIAKGSVKHASPLAASI